MGIFGGWRVFRFGVNDPEHNVLGAAATGGIATVFHDGIMTPLDVIKQRLQVRGDTSPEGRAPPYPLDFRTPASSVPP